MKTIHKILLATAAAASFTLIDRAQNIVSPAHPWVNQPVIAPGQNNDPDLLQYNANWNAKMAEEMASTVMAPNANSDRDPNLLQEIAAMPGTGKQKDQQQLQLQGYEQGNEVVAER